MSTNLRFRFWEQGLMVTPPATALAGPAASGEAVERLVVLTARSLLEAGHADRAAVLLRSEYEAGILEGSVVDAGFPGLLESWERLDATDSEVSRLLKIREPLRMSGREVQRATALGPLARMKSAVILPLRCADEVLGLAVVAYALKPASGWHETLQSIADHLALSVSQRRLEARSRRLGARLKAIADLERRQAAGEPLDAFLKRVAEIARRESGASFVTVGRRSRAGKGIALAAFDGPAEILPLLNHAELARVWRPSTPVHRPAVENLPTTASRANWGEALRQQGTEVILVLPLQGCGTLVGTLAVGIRAGQSPAAVRETLEPFAALTASRMAERGRKERNAELAAILDSMECGVLLFDAERGLRLTNARFAEMFGLTPERLAKLVDFEALLGALRDRFEEASTVERRWREILSRGDEPARDELEISSPRRRVVERFARPVQSEDGEHIGWLELYRDITRERLVQSKLMQAEKMAALGQLVSGIAHELNNPLTGIMGYAQLLLRHAPGGERGAEALRIFEEAERAGRIVKNLLLFARDKKPERRPVDLNGIIGQTLALRSYELRVRNIAMVSETDPELPPVLADAHQLQQVVLNLLVNAEQAIQPGRHDGRITVRTRQTANHRVVLEVMDNGPGIPPDITPRVFDPFFTTKPVGTGTGLGLSIVYGIVQEHGGEIALETRPGNGTRFTIELPTAPAGAKAVGEELPATPRPAPRTARGEKILVIEDEATVAHLVVDVLREEGHQVEVLLDSVEGLKQISRQRYDLVICDLRMPRLDGRELFLTLVRKGDATQHRIVFITGDTLTPSTVEFLERNSLPYLAKPFLVEELKRVVERTLDAGRLSRRDRSRAEPGSMPDSPAEKEGPHSQTGNSGRRQPGPAPERTEFGYDARSLSTEIELGDWGAR